MQSQITYIDSDTLRPAPDLSAGRVLVSSQALAWDGLYIEKGENDGFIPNDVTLTQHYFAMHVGPPLEWEWKDGSQFKTHCYRAGDLWVNPAGIPFSHRISGYNQFVLLTLDPAKLAELVPDRLLLQHQAFQRRHQAQDRHLQSMIQTLLVEAELGGPNGRLFADTLGTAIATHFVNHYSLDSANPWPQLSPMDRQRLGRVVDYIEAHLTADLTLAELALQAGLSKFHFSRLFKDATDFTPHRYVQQRRIERAAQALRRRGVAIAAVAVEFGFADQSHFTRVFKQVKGVTPKQFLALHR